MLSKKRKFESKSAKSAKRPKIDKDAAIKFRQDKEEQSWNELADHFLRAFEKNVDFPPWESGIFLQRQAMSVSGTVYSGRNSLILIMSMLANDQQTPVFGTFKAWNALFTKLKLDKSRIHIRRKPKTDEKKKMSVSIFSMKANVAVIENAAAPDGVEFRHFADFNSGKWIDVFNIAQTTLTDPDNQEELAKVMDHVKDIFKDAETKKAKDLIAKEKRILKKAIADGKIKAEIKKRPELKRDFEEDFSKATGWELKDRKPNAFTESQALEVYNRYSEPLTPAAVKLKAEMNKQKKSIEGFDFERVRKPELKLGTDSRDKVVQWHLTDMNPYYSTSTDRIVMPGCSSFTDPESFASVLFHELAHSTGHHTRLARFDEKGANIPSAGLNASDINGLYALEEMIAEMCTSFLCKKYELLTPRRLGLCGSYMNIWAKQGKLSSEQIRVAVSAAIKAFDFITNKYGKY